MAFLLCSSHELVHLHKFYLSFAHQVLLDLEVTPQEDREEKLDVLEHRQCLCDPYRAYELF